MDRLQLDLHAARQNFAEGLPLPQGLVPEPIARSWERSRSAGLLPWRSRLTHGHPDVSPLTDADQHLAECVQPELERLWESIGDSNWMLFCVNPDHRIVQTRQPARRDGPLAPLHQGRRVSEIDLGTTAPACTLAEGIPAIVAGNQHYLQEFSDFFCASVPLRGADGQLLGALDLTGIGTRNAGTMLERLKHAALAIENNFFHTLPGCRLLELQHDPRLLDSPLQALLAVHDDGTVVAANRAAQQLLGIGSYQPEALSLWQLLDGGSQACLDFSPRLLTLADGSRLYAKLHGREKSKPAAFAQPRSTLGSDPRVTARFEHARRAVTAKLPVLITGPTGSGKEVFARALHARCCPNAPYVAINCASMPDSLIEAELFGYADGTFTGARKGGAIGLLESAKDGMVLLDEIGDMPLHLQSRLLRVLQERRAQRLGSTREIAIEAHIVAATHRSLSQLVAKGRFREDLYYRLTGLCVELPPLDERLDKSELVNAFFERPGMQPLDDTARRLLHGYAWPGNLRQLDNAASLAAVLSVGEPLITVEHLPEEIRGGERAASRRLCDATRNTIESTLQAHQGNVTAAAKELGISRTTLYKWLGKRQR